MYRLFVFGTLKAGFPNHRSNHGSRLPGRFVTAEAHPLYLVGERHSPWLVDDPGSGMPVYGEVYRVDEADLRRMDRLERVGEADGYRRRRIEIVDEASGERFEAEAYLKPLEQLQALSQDALRSGPHAEYTPQLAALYRPRNQTPSAF